MLSFNSRPTTSLSHLFAVLCVLGWGLTIGSAFGEETKPQKGHTLNMGCYPKSLAFSPDGRLLAVGGGAQFGSGGAVKLFDPTTGKEVAQFKMKNDDPVWSVAFSPDGKTLALGRQNHTVELWDVATRKRIAVFPVGKETVHCVAYSPDGKTIAAGSYESDDKLLRTIGFVKLFDTATGRARATLTGHTHWIDAVAFSPDGKTLASASSDKAVKLWDPTTGRERLTLKGHTFAHLRVIFSADGKVIATGSWDETIRLWDAESGKELHALKGHGSGIQGLAFSPDAKVVAAVVLNRTVFLWDVSMGKELARFPAHKGELYCVAFSPDGKTLATGSRDETVQLWDVTKVVLPKPEK